MINFITITIVMIVAIYFLFFYHHTPLKTLSAARWMILTWLFLFVIHIVSPVQFLSFTLSYTTIIYCIAWVIVFCIGERFGFFINYSNNSRKQIQIRLTYKNIIFMVLCAFIGMLGLAYSSVNSLDLVSNMGDLRDLQLEGEQSGILKTASTFMACIGLVAFLIATSVSILNNNKLTKFSFIGLAAYFSVTFFTAGRSGVIFGIISIFVVFIASLQLSIHENTKIKSLLINFLFILILGVFYIMYVVSTRTTGWTGSMDIKISLINNMLQSSLDENFRESLRSYGAFGDMIIEIFYYLSPQIYGLEHAIKFYDGNFGLGAVQFPYFTRRFENVFQTEILNHIYDADKATYENWGLAANFFRTAVHTTYLDFGLVFSLFFVFITGIFAGRIRKISLTSKSPFYIAFQGLICAGSAWTIIFSPFVEQSWAFPILFFIIIIIFVHYIKPFYDAASTTPITQSRKTL